LSPSAETLYRQLAAAPAADANWSSAYRLAFGMLRQCVELHPRGRTPSEVFDAAVSSLRGVAEECLPLGMALTMHLYPLCALRCLPLSSWSLANVRRHRLLRAIDRHGLILANAGSERVRGRQALVELTQESGGVRIDGTFEYVSLAHVADLVLFSAPTTAGHQVFCIADLRAESVRLGSPRFAGSMSLTDTCSITFEGYFVPSRWLATPGEAALECAARYQRCWFHLLAGEVHLARLERLRQRWQLARTPEDLACLNELRLLREYALRLLDNARKPAALDSLAQVSAAFKLRTSWQCQAVAESLRHLDADSAAELRFLARQPTADESILRNIASTGSGTCGCPGRTGPGRSRDRRRWPPACTRERPAPGCGHGVGLPGPAR
jgi:hypothetical protein